MQTTDRDLWERATGGDRAAFAELFDRHAKAVYNDCFRLTASWSDAEDLTSIVFLQAWRRRGQVRLSYDSALPWLLTVATNAARNEWRSRPPTTWAARPARCTRSRPGSRRGRRQPGRRRRRMAELLAAVRRLPPAEAQALALCIWSGVGYAEAAEVLGISESSVRSRVSRARSRLTSFIAQQAAAPISLETP